jgi:hypothetical protein
LLVGISTNQPKKLMQKSNVMIRQLQTPDMMVTFPCRAMVTGVQNSSVDFCRACCHRAINCPRATPLWQF